MTTNYVIKYRWPCGQEHHTLVGAENLREVLGIVGPAADCASHKAACSSVTVTAVEDENG